MKKLVDYIGEPALLEQTAEECMELAFACLKLARMKRGENKVWGHTEDELVKKIEEECADVEVCIEELINAKIVDYRKAFEWKCTKKQRMQDRLDLEDKKKEDEKIKSLSGSDTWSFSFSLDDTELTEDTRKMILGEKKPEEKKEEKFSKECLNNEIEEEKRKAFEIARKIGQLGKEEKKLKEKSTSNPLIDMAAMFLTYLLLGELGDQKKDDKDNRKA